MTYLKTTQKRRLEFTGDRQTANEREVARTIVVSHLGEYRSATIRSLNFVYPIWRLVVMFVEQVFVFTSDRGALVKLRACLDGFPGESNVYCRICPTYVFDPCG